jgi:hypothetical protein
MDKFVNKYTKNMDAESIQEALTIAKELKEAVEKNDQQKIKELQSSKAILLMLLEYLIRSSSNPSIDPNIIITICNFLGINISEEEKKETGIEEEQEKEEEQPEKERKEHLYRVACYELYKLVNPNKLAGETDMSNFLNNAQRVGIREALKYADPELSRQITKQAHVIEEPKAAAKESFVDQIEKTGKGGPVRGLS